jgi:hypothetical protein
VFVIDSKRYRGRLWLGPDGMLWYAGFPLAQQLATVVWATMRLAEALQLPPRCRSGRSWSSTAPASPSAG